MGTFDFLCGPGINIKNMGGISAYTGKVETV